MKKIAVLFSGRGSNFAHIINTLHNKELEIVVALTNNPKAEGIEIAKEANIPLVIIDSKAYTNREEFDAVVVKSLQEYHPDLTVLAGFMRILTPIFTEQINAINLHPSLLPRHKGLKAIEKSYEDEHPEGGVSVHHVSSELDGGEVILQQKILKKSLSLEEYTVAVRSLEKELLVEAIQQELNIEGFNMTDDNQDLFQRIGVDISKDKINIDLTKTKDFFSELEGIFKEKAENIQEDISMGKEDLAQNIGIKIDNENINIDFGKTKSFIEELGKKIEGFVEEIDEAVKNIDKR